MFEIQPKQKVIQHVFEFYEVKAANIKIVRVSVHFDEPLDISVVSQAANVLIHS